MGLVFCPGVCRECGCSDDKPCEGGCYWAEPDLCSRCDEDDEEDLFDALFDL